MLRVYDTSKQASRDQFDYWRDELCHNLVEMAPERGRRSPRQSCFDGRLYQQNLDVLSIARLTAESHSVNRTRFEISRSSEEYYFANLQLAGRGYARQGGLEIETKPGDLVLINSTQPYLVSHDESFDMVSIKIPHGLLAHRLELRRSSIASYIPAERGYGAVLRSYTRSIMEEIDTESIDSAPFLAENLVSLIASSLNSAEARYGSAKLGHQQYLRLQAVLGHIKISLADPDLDLPGVAAHFGLSPRYVQKLIAATGSTFSQTVLNWRLDRVATCLRSSEFAHTTLSQIALAWGFNDLSHFSRSFKARFGANARDYRRSK